MIRTSSRWLAAAALLAGTAGAASAADTYVNATVGGVLSPGVYGRIDIGTAPPPPVIYAQPMIIQRPVVAAPVQPVYMYVPPGHAKKWSKHCHRYNACGVPVYFARVDRQGHYIADNRKDQRAYRAAPPAPAPAPMFAPARPHPGEAGRGRGRDHDDDHQGRGHGKGRGHGRD